MNGDVIEAYKTKIPTFRAGKFAGMKSVLVTVKVHKVCDGFRYNATDYDYYEDENHIRYPVLKLLNPFSCDVLENDGTYHKTVLSIEDISHQTT